MTRPPPRSPLFPHTPLFRSRRRPPVGERRQDSDRPQIQVGGRLIEAAESSIEARSVLLLPKGEQAFGEGIDRKSTRLNSSHANISYAVFCLKKKRKRSISEH